MTVHARADPPGRSAGGHAAARAGRGDGVRRLARAHRRDGAPPPPRARARALAGRRGEGRTQGVRARTAYSSAAAPPTPVSSRRRARRRSPRCRASCCSPRRRPRSGGTTVTPSLARAGSAPNVVPEEAELTVDARAWTEAEAERVDAALRAYVPADARVSVEVEGGFDRPPLEPTDASQRALRGGAARGGGDRLRAGGGACRRRVGRELHRGGRGPDARRPRDPTAAGRTPGTSTCSSRTSRGGRRFVAALLTTLDD